MADYRLYFLDAANHIRRAVEFECEDDAAATTRALAEADGRCMELWSRSRFVRRFESAHVEIAPPGDRGRSGRYADATRLNADC